MFGEPDNSFRDVVTNSSLKKVIDHYLASGWQADLATVTGDLIQDDTAEAYERFKEIVAPLDLPIHCVPGNHDVREVMRQALSAAPFSYCSSIAINNWLIVGIDSCKAGKASGAIVAAEYERMNQVIAASDAEHIMICLHHPPLPMGSAWLDTVGLAEPEQFFEQVAKSGRVRLAILGHVHQAFDGEHNGLRIIATPSTCRQFLPRSDDFAVDDQPPAYRRISLFPDGHAEEELIWVEDA